MSLPGFTRTPSPVAADDRVVLQHITCEEEHGPPCWTHCEDSWNPTDCMRKCIKKNCYGSGNST
ncbi:hypothetical protein [Streptomyces europaeiscabiei]|uniref:hypothetical protein n=1 Tax=Streptomyces europaeiscabiei TaxID=146819 RepID=UPI0038F783D8